MTRCNNKAMYYYANKNRTTQCGSTGPWGEAIMCPSCNDKIENGEMLQPGYCKHGNRMHDDADQDLYCAQCELGD